MTEPEQEMRTALREVGEELTRAVEQATLLARQVAEDVARLFTERPAAGAAARDAAAPGLISDLARLRDEGLVSEEEFAAKKAELLSRM